MMLREYEVFDISKVEYGIVEANGKLSIVRKPQHEKITIKDLNLPDPASNVPVTIIMDGKLNDINIKKLKLSKQDILNLMKQQGLNVVDDVFYATLDANNNMNISKYDETVKDFFANADKN